MPVNGRTHIDEIQDEIVAEFAMFDDKMGKYEYLMDLGRELPGIDEKYKIDSNIVKGCQSTVWLYSEFAEDGTVNFYAESDAFIVRGMVALLLRIYSGQPAEDIIRSDSHFIDEIGLNNLLSSNRSNGLASMLKQMKYYAIAYSHKS